MLKKIFGRSKSPSNNSPYTFEAVRQILNYVNMFIDPTVAGLLRLDDAFDKEIKDLEEILLSDSYIQTIKQAKRFKQASPGNFTHALGILYKRYFSNTLILPATDPNVAQLIIELQQTIIDYSELKASSLEPLKDSDLADIYLCIQSSLEKLLANIDMNQAEVIHDFIHIARRIADGQRGQIEEPETSIGMLIAPCLLKPLGIHGKLCPPQGTDEFDITRSMSQEAQFMKIFAKAALMSDVFKASFYQTFYSGSSMSLTSSSSSSASSSSSSSSSSSAAPSPSVSPRIDISALSLRLELDETGFSEYKLGFSEMACDGQVMKRRMESASASASASAEETDEEEQSLLDSLGRLLITESPTTDFSPRTLRRVTDLTNSYLAHSSRVLPRVTSFSTAENTVESPTLKRSG